MARKQKPHRVSTTAGGFDAYLGVRNASLYNERGFRLEWVACDGKTSMPVFGLATSNPFRTARAATSFGLKHFGRRAVRVPAVGVGPRNVCDINAPLGRARRRKK